MSESFTKIYKPKVRFESSNRYNIVKGIVKKNDKYITETIVAHKNSILEIVKKEITIT